MLSYAGAAALTLTGEAGTVSADRMRLWGFEMALLRILACLMAVCALMTTPPAEAGQRGRPAPTPGGVTGFSGGTFSCLEFTNGLGGNSVGRIQSTIARLWMLGYLTGYYKGKDTLEFSTDPGESAAMDALLVQKCKETPSAPILTVALQGIVVESRKLPELALGEFKPGTYTCGQHLDAKDGPASKANAADLAEMWGFGFIQGFKNVAQPDVEIQPEFRDTLVGALNRACGNSRDKLFLEMAAQVADRVKIK